MKSPIFLLSLPRSGSTLLQRVLMGHSEISSLAEPWLMLPFSYAYKKNGTISEYSHDLSYQAFDDFIENLPKKEKDYNESLQVFLSDLYTKQCKNNEKYFLDKTPRYYYIIDEIIKIFPNAKFIILLRNPVHVLSSAINTWSNGSLRKEYFFHDDIYFAPKALAEACESLAGKAFIVKYENFIKSPEKVTKEICNYLDLEYEKSMVDNFSKQETKGRHGDPVGTKEYKEISSSPLNKWKVTFNTAYKIHYLKSYIKKIDQDNIFDRYGYDRNMIEHEIDNIRVNYLSSIIDIYDHFRSNIVRRIKLYLYKSNNNIGKWSRNKYLN